MPFWAIVYCLLIILSGIGVVIMYKKRPTYYIPGQVLSSLCGVLMFLFYYDSFVHKPLSFLVFWQCFPIFCIGSYGRIDTFFLL